MNEEEYESPYCEICGTCGYLGCCGIRNFISGHIEGKTNCKNEGLIIHELEDLCDYKDEVFEENKQLKERIDTLKETQIKQLQIIKDKDEIIDKAIELLNNRSHTSDIITNMFNNLNTMDKAIEILKGSEE